MANALIVIRPYRREGVWVFDDPAAGLEQEPFVAGVPEMIERFVAGIPDAENGFELTFSAEPFPGHQAKLIWLRREYEGNWYGWPETRQEGWLCPALFRYFEKAPEALYCLARPRASDGVTAAGGTDLSLSSIDAKLDRILAQLASLDQRIASLEQSRREFESSPTQDDAAKRPERLEKH
jgi:hypothetical protein